MIMELKKSTDLSFFETTGFSMWPFLRGGEKLIVKRTATEDLKIGDIIIYRTKDPLACHRLIKKIKKEGKYIFYVRGDNSTSLPEPIAEEMFLGKVVSIVKDANVIALNRLKWRFINRVIVLVAPLISWGVRIIRPWYSKIKVLGNNGK